MEGVLALTRCFSSPSSSSAAAAAAAPTDHHITDHTNAGSTNTTTVNTTANIPTTTTTTSNSADGGNSDGNGGPNAAHAERPSDCHDQQHQRQENEEHTRGKEAKNAESNSNSIGSSVPAVTPPAPPLLPHNNNNNNDTTACIATIGSSPSAPASACVSSTPFDVLEAAVLEAVCSHYRARRRRLSNLSSRASLAASPPLPHLSLFPSSPVIAVSPPSSPSPVTDKSGCGGGGGGGGVLNSNNNNTNNNTSSNSDNSDDTKRRKREGGDGENNNSNGNSVAAVALTRCWRALCDGNINGCESVTQSNNNSDGPCNKHEHYSSDLIRRLFYTNEVLLFPIHRPCCLHERESGFDGNNEESSDEQQQKHQQQHSLANGIITSAEAEGREGEGRRRGRGERDIRHHAVTDAARKPKGAKGALFNDTTHGSADSTLLRCDRNNTGGQDNQGGEGEESEEEEEDEETALFEDFCVFLHENFSQYVTARLTPLVAAWEDQLREACVRHCLPLVEAEAERASAAAAAAAAAAAVKVQVESKQHQQQDQEQQEQQQHYQEDGGNATGASPSKRVKLEENDDASRGGGDSKEASEHQANSSSSVSGSNTAAETTGVNVANDRPRRRRVALFMPSTTTTTTTTTAPAQTVGVEEGKGSALQTKVKQEEVENEEEEKDGGEDAKEKKHHSSEPPSHLDTANLQKLTEGLSRQMRLFHAIFLSPDGDARQALLSDVKTEVGLDNSSGNMGSGGVAVCSREREVPLCLCDGIEHCPHQCVKEKDNEGGDDDGGGENNARAAARFRFLERLDRFLFSENGTPTSMEEGSIANGGGVDPVNVNAAATTNTHSFCSSPSACRNEAATVLRCPEYPQEQDEEEEEKHQQPQQQQQQRHRHHHHHRHCPLRRCWMEPGSEEDLYWESIARELLIDLHTNNEALFPPVSSVTPGDRRGPDATGNNTNNNDGISKNSSSNNNSTNEEKEKEVIHTATTKQHSGGGDPRARVCRRLAALPLVPRTHLLLRHSALRRAFLSYAANSSDESFVESLLGISSSSFSSSSSSSFFPVSPRGDNAEGTAATSSASAFNNNSNNNNNNCGANKPGSDRLKSALRCAGGETWMMLAEDLFGSEAPSLHSESEESENDPEENDDAKKSQRSEKHSDRRSCTRYRQRDSTQQKRYQQQQQQGECKRWFTLGCLSLFCLSAAETAVRHQVERLCTLYHLSCRFLSDVAPTMAAAAALPPVSSANGGRTTADVSATAAPATTTITTTTTTSSGSTRNISSVVMATMKRENDRDDAEEEAAVAGNAAAGVSIKNDPSSSSSAAAAAVLSAAAEVCCGMTTSPCSCPSCRSLPQVPLLFLLLSGNSDVAAYARWVVGLLPPMSSSSSSSSSSPFSAVDLSHLPLSPLHLLSESDNMNDEQTAPVPSTESKQCPTLVSRVVSLFPPPLLTPTLADFAGFASAPFSSANTNTTTSATHIGGGDDTGNDIGAVDTRGIASCMDLQHLLAQTLTQPSVTHALIQSLLLLSSSAVEENAMVAAAGSNHTCQIGGGGGGDAKETKNKSKNSNKRNKNNKNNNNRKVAAAAAEQNCSLEETNVSGRKSQFTTIIQTLFDLLFARMTADAIGTTTTCIFGSQLLSAQPSPSAASLAPLSPSLLLLKDPLAASLVSSALRRTHNAARHAGDGTRSVSGAGSAAGTGADTTTTTTTAASAAELSDALWAVLAEWHHTCLSPLGAAGRLAASVAAVSESGSVTRSCHRSDTEGEPAEKEECAFSGDKSGREVKLKSAAPAAAATEGETQRSVPPPPPPPLVSAAPGRRRVRLGANLTETTAATHPTGKGGNASEAANQSVSKRRSCDIRLECNNDDNDGGAKHHHPPFPHEINSNNDNNNNNNSHNNTGRRLDGHAAGVGIGTKRPRPRPRRRRVSIATPPYLAPLTRLMESFTCAAAAAAQEAGETGEGAAGGRREGGGGGGDDGTMGRRRTAVMQRVAAAKAGETADVAAAVAAAASPTLCKENPYSYCSCGVSATCGAMVRAVLSALVPAWTAELSNVVGALERVHTNARANGMAAAASATAAAPADTPTPAGGENLASKCNSSSSSGSSHNRTNVGDSGDAVTTSLEQKQRQCHCDAQLQEALRLVCASVCGMRYYMATISTHLLLPQHRQYKQQQQQQQRGRNLSDNTTHKCDVGRCVISSLGSWRSLSSAASVGGDGSLHHHHHHHNYHQESGDYNTNSTEEHEGNTFNKAKYETPSPHPRQAAESLPLLLSQRLQPLLPSLLLSVPPSLPPPPLSGGEATDNGDSDDWGDALLLQETREAIEWICNELH